jgi:hypothetical protein
MESDAPPLISCHSFYTVVSVHHGSDQAIFCGHLLFYVLNVTKFMRRVHAPFSLKPRGPPPRYLLHLYYLLALSFTFYFAAYSQTITVRNLHGMAEN